MANSPFLGLIYWGGVALGGGTLDSLDYFWILQSDFWILLLVVLVLPPLGQQCGAKTSPTVGCL